MFLCAQVYMHQMWGCTRQSLTKGYDEVFVNVLIVNRKGSIYPNLNYNRMTVINNVLCSYTYCMCINWNMCCYFKYQTSFYEISCFWCLYIVIFLFLFSIWELNVLFKAIQLTTHVLLVTWSISYYIRYS